MALIQLGTRDGSLLGNPPVGDYYLFLDSNNNDIFTKRDSNGKDTTLEGNPLQNQVIVTQSNVATTLGGTIDSDKDYFLDGEIDLGNISIEVPAGGIHISGYGYDISKLFSSENNYTLFTSPVGGSGNVLLSHFTICVTGTNSQVYDLTDVSGFNAIEIEVINYQDCTSLGNITNYRQGLELNTGRFGGTPELTLSGAWLGGFRISTSIVRMLVDGSYTLFKAGAGLVFNSRFLTDINCDLPTNTSLLDFSPSNFAVSSSLQLKDCIITRNGVSDPSDSNLTPNITADDLESVWRTNQGLRNTYVGFRADISTEVLTPILVSSTYVTLMGTWNNIELVHFTSTTNGQWINSGVSPIDFKFNIPLILDGGANDEYSVRLRKFDSNTMTTSTITEQTRRIQNVIGGNDVGYFNLLGAGTLNQNDYVFLEVANVTDTTDCTLLIGSLIETIER